MPAAPHDRMRGIIKQIVNIKNIVIIWRKIIVKIIVFQINRSFYIHPIVAKIQQAHPFGKREGTVFLKAVQCEDMRTQKLFRLQIGSRSQFFTGKTSQTNMFILKCDGTAVIQCSIFFGGCVNSFFHGNLLMLSMVLV